MISFFVFWIRHNDIKTNYYFFSYIRLAMLIAYLGGRMTDYI